MSVITVQVGQCGNQIGASLFSKLAEEATASSDDFREATHEVHLARCASLGVWH
jgi:hypothetical protein